jgi:hypothetical protein
MLLIIEIILTVAAWRKGWKAWALLPVGIAMTVGFITGIAISVDGGSIDDVVGFLLVSELIVLGSLIVMAVRAPRHVKKLEEIKLAEPVLEIETAQIGIQDTQSIPV